MRASDQRHREKRRKADHERYWSNAERRAERNRQKALWRKANPEKVAAQKKRYIARRTKAYVRYHAKYRKRFTLHRRDLIHRLTQSQRRPIPRCKKCGGSTRWKAISGQPGKPWEKCAKCSWPFELKRRRANRRKLLRAATIAFGLKKKPIRRPEHSPRRGPGDERLCLTIGCDTVLTHRKKKCSKCRRREAELAAQELAHTAGRGRRVDLERRIA